MDATFPLPFVPGHQPLRPAVDSHHFVFHARTLLVTEEGILPGSIDVDGVPKVRSQYIGTLAETHCFAHQLATPELAPPGFVFRDLRALGGAMSRTLLTVAGRAVQLLEWDRTHQFCGACAAPTTLSAKEHARHCDACSLVFYPRLSPAIIVAVERGDEILLGRSPHFPPGIFSVLAGFVEPGESAETAVVREVFEETGITVDTVRYFNSQPWPFPNSLMLGFTAQYVRGEVNVDPNEIEAAGFFSVDQLPPTFAGNMSISQWLLADFIRRHRLS